MSFSFAKLNQICNEIALNFTRRKRKHPHVLVHLYILHCWIATWFKWPTDSPEHLAHHVHGHHHDGQDDDDGDDDHHDGQDGKATKWWTKDHLGKKWTHNYKRFVCWFNGIFVMANTMLTMLMHILNYSIPPFLNIQSQERCFNFIFVLNFSLFSPLSPSNGDWISKCWIKFSQN